jgi:hypothetical protein
MSGCWQCGADNDRAAVYDMTEATPSAGDASVCLYCRAVGIFTGNGLETRAPDFAEHAALLADPDVREAIRTAEIVHRGYVSENN